MKAPSRQHVPCRGEQEARVTRAVTMQVRASKVSASALFPFGTKEAEVTHQAAPVAGACTASAELDAKLSAKCSYWIAASKAK